MRTDTDTANMEKLARRLLIGWPDDLEKTGNALRSLAAKRDALLSARCPDCQWPTGQACPTCETTKDKK